MKLTIHSTIDNKDGGEPEISITTHEADVRISADTLYVRYKEESEGASVKTLITATQSGIRLSKRGAVEWDVIFSSGETSATVYKIPPYAFDAEVITDTAAWTENNGVHTVRLVYSMNIGGADKDIRMKMTLK